MIRFGAHAFIWEPEWDQEAAERVVQHAHNAGLALIEVPLLHPESFDPAFMRRLLDEFGLDAAYSLGLPTDRRLPDYPEEAKRFLIQAVDRVAAAGGRLLSGVLYGTLGEITGHRPTQRDYDIIARVLRTVANYAGDHGVSLGIEPVNRYETYLINTVEQALAVIEQIDASNVVLHLDTYHVNIEEESFLQAIRQAGHRLRYVHLSESHRGIPGTGTVMWDDVFQALREIEFQGDLVMESFVALHPDIARATCLWRDVAPSSEVLVKEGLTFLKNKAREYGLRV